MEKMQEKKNNTQKKYIRFEYFSVHGFETFVLFLRKFLFFKPINYKMQAKRKKSKRTLIWTGFGTNYK